MVASSLSFPAQPRKFFARSAIVMAVLVFLSFPLTYYLPVITESRDFHVLHHVHGFAFFAWISLYVWQTQLVAQGKIARHREIGVLGAVLTGSMIPLGYWMAQRAAETRLANGAAHPYEFSWFNAVDIGLFSILMIASMALVTKHKEWHRRLTFVAALCLVAPAVTRWSLKLPYLDPIALDVFSYLIMYPFLVALVVYDTRTLGKWHPATMTCIAVLIPLQISGAWIARSEWWNGVAPWVFGSP